MNTCNCRCLPENREEENTWKTTNYGSLDWGTGLWEGKKFVQKEKGFFPPKTVSFTYFINLWKVHKHHWAHIISSLPVDTISSLFPSVYLPISFLTPRLNEDHTQVSSLSGFQEIALSHDKPSFTIFNFSLVCSCFKSIYVDQKVWKVKVQCQSLISQDSPAFY